MGLGHSPRIVTDGLVLCLDAANKRSYPGTGTTWTDRSANGNDGTLTNMDTSNFSSDNGGVLIFDGTDEYVALGNASNLISSSQNTVTVCSWIRPDVVGSYKKIFTVAASPSSIQSFYFSIGPYPYNVYMGIKTSSFARAVSSSNLSTTEFTCLSSTYDGSTIKLYINGVEVASSSQTGNIPTDGTARISGYGNGAEHWDGVIASFSMYNKVLTAEEIRQNFEATKGRYE